MKKLSILLLLLAFNATVFSQTLKTRSDGTFTQADTYLVGLKTLGVPFGATNTLNSGLARNGQLFYNTTTKLLYVYDVGNAAWKEVAETDLSTYFTKTEVNNLLALKADKTNGLISTGGISLVGTTVTITAPIIWFINGVTYTKATNSVFTINSATAEFYRKDLIYATTSSTLIKLEGAENASAAIEPTLPAGTIKVSVVDVFGSDITQPEPDLSNYVTLGYATANYSPKLTFSGGLTRTLNNVTTNSTVATLTGTQTLTNKTLTSPVINSPTGIVKANVGLGGVDNTSDLNKPVSTLTQTALNLKADDAGVVHIAGAETIVGVKTFTNSILLTNGTQTFTTSLGTMASQAGQPYFASSAGYYVFQPTTTAVAPRFYLIPKGAPSGTSGKFEIFNTDYVADAANYSALNIITNNINNDIQIGANRLGSATRLKMVLGGDYIGSALQTTSNSVVFNTDNTTLINPQNGAVSFGTTVTDPFSFSINNQYTFKNPALNQATRFNIIGNGTAAGVLAYGTGSIRNVSTSVIGGTSDYVISTNSTNTGTAVTDQFRVFGATGNLVLQNGGAFTDAGYRLDIQGTGRFSGIVTAPTFTGALIGNANTATTLATARTINGVSFNGSANVTIPTSTTITNITYASLLTAISGSTLTAGQTYKITDRGDRGLFFKAISTNELSQTGIRKMLCPKKYSTGSLDGNSWKGVWHSTKTVVVNDLMVWGGLVWKNLTGAIGSKLSVTALDATNWVVIPKASFTNSEYVELQFEVLYDISNDWITKQWDKSGNVFGVSYNENQFFYANSYNWCDISDWNFTEGNIAGTKILYNNKCNGIYNNSEGTLIYNNSNKGTINYNKVTSNISNNVNQGNINDNTATDIIYNHSKGHLSTNSVANIEANHNNGYISNNTMPGSITSNKNGGYIGSNTCISITENHIKGNISSNSNSNAIQSNSSNIDRITGNTFNGRIWYNANNGDIINCTGATAHNIEYNTNNGNITGAHAANVSDAIVNK